MPIENLPLFSQERDFLVAKERISDESKGETYAADAQRAERRE
jgi:hypothetical protein